MKLSIIFASLFFSVAVNAESIANSPRINFNDWLKSEVAISQEKLLQAISRPDTARGAVIASPSKSNPDYYYHWTRDAGLTMDVAADLYIKAPNQKLKNIWNQKLIDYIEFSKSNQVADALTGLGEPKFYVDGKPYDLPWGRPQNDGPALRALALIKFAQAKIAEGEIKFVVENLYSNELPAKSVIKADLEFVSHQWQQPSFDLWEEVLGDHYFTRIVQKTALEQGAKLAQTLGDTGASDWYLRQAQKIAASLKDYSNSELPYLLTTVNRRGGMDTKKSNLDVAVILGILRSNNFNLTFNWGDPKILGTLESLNDAFAGIYPINRANKSLGVAIGRYPEDVYGGDNFDGGNPWVLTTLAVAEAYYELAAWTKKYGGSKIAAQKYFELGELYFKRVQYHANADGSLSEQISRFNGYLTSAYDLTWNYSAILTTYWARERALQ